MTELQESFWKVNILFIGKGNLSDLEFRLFWGIPAWFYYKWRRTLKGPIKFKRYSEWLEQKK